MKKLMLFVCLAVFSAPLAAQPGPGGPGPMAGGPGGAPPAAPDQVLKDVLDFTDAQLTSFHSLADARRTATQSAQSQMRDAEKAVHDALVATTPDALTVGKAVLAVESLRAQIRRAETDFQAAFANLLTPAQREKVAAIKTVASEVAAGGFLKQIGAI